MNRVLTRRVVLMSKNDRQQAEAAVRAVQELIEADVAAVLDKGNRELCEQWLADFKIPFLAGVYAYDAARVVLTALKARRQGQHLKAALLSIGEFDGLQGRIRYDACGDVAPAHASIRIVRNLKFVVVE
jgi:branched-chain amino acid transport system substrate-binding protein